MKWDHQAKISHITSVLNVLEEFMAGGCYYKWTPNLGKLQQRDLKTWASCQIWTCVDIEEAARHILLRHTLDPEW